MKHATFYWHNGRSLGHTYGSRKLISALAATPSAPGISALTGAFTGLEPLHSFCDVVKLPGFTNVDAADGWHPRSRSGIPYDVLIALRSDLASTYLSGARPDLLVVNHEPFGYATELEDAISLVGDDTIKVLTLRGVLYDRQKTAKEYFAGPAAAFIDAHYSAIHVRIDPDVFDLADHYDVPGSLMERLRYVGYLDARYARSREECRADVGLAGDLRVLVAAMGGGQGCGGIWRALIAALEDLPMFDRAILVPGPYLEPADRAWLQSVAAAAPNVDVRVDVDDLRPYMVAADVFVGAAGANTISEVVATRANAVLLARQVKEVEQEIHSQALRRRKLARAVALRDWDRERIVAEVRRGLADPYPQAPAPLLDGATSSAALFSDYLSIVPSTKAVTP